MANSSEKPKLLLLALEHQPWFDEMYENFLDTLLESYQLQRAKTPAGALRILSSLDSKPTAVLLTDPGARTHANVMDTLVEYAQSGGIVLCMGCFSSFIPRDDVLKFFNKFGLSWTDGSYHRTTTAINPAFSHANRNHLFPSYSQKALFLKDVSPADAIYTATDESVIESRVFPPDKIENLTEAAAAFKSVGDGFIGYMGDVNNEKETQTLVLSMCK